MQEYPEKMQHICKLDKIIQAERIWETKHKTTTEPEELNVKYKQTEKEKTGVEKKYVSKKVYDQTKIIIGQIYIKLKNLYQEKEILEKVIKALRSMIKTKIDSVPEKELQIKQLEISLEK